MPYKTFAVYFTLDNGNGRNKTRAEVSIPSEREV
jgi:hypothetical protein